MVDMTEPDPPPRVKRASLKLLEAAVYSYAMLRGPMGNEHARERAMSLLREAIRQATGDLD